MVARRPGPRKRAGVAGRLSLAQVTAMGWWDRHVVPHLIRLACSQGEIMKRRALVVPQARGAVLEVGCGGGINLGLYDRARLSRLVGLDPHPALARMARERARDLDLPLRVVEGVAEELPFSTAAFDTVVVTFTLCSVHDPEAALAEIRRVLAPGGHLLFLEHGLAPDPGVARTQRRLEPLWRRLAGGCHLTRPVTSGIVSAGFRLLAGDRGYARRAPRFAGWMEWGVAEKA